jgi:hypothetical protein
VAAIEFQRAELQRLYLAVIAADGINGVHRLLSEALINQRAKDKKRKPAARSPVRTRSPIGEIRPRLPKGPSTLEWNGKTIVLSTTMRSLTLKQQRYVLARVHDGLSRKAAERIAGYGAGGGDPHRSAHVQRAMNEERARSGQA